jgi:hypothetical protein
MSDSAPHTAEASHETTSSEPLFNQSEIDQFDADDTQAGRAIGKMLSYFFLYTVIAMSIASYWTYRSLQ